ncbi:hypothetical protein AAD018_004360 [Aestuariibius insulae]|uniref:hypothetical protein n=1 Tax=Aestuariibius insulae TaxID=2058287 RepID=UPI00345EFBCA
MTALERYQRLETGGLWRAGSDDQRRNVTVTFGEATLVISDKAGRALSHWSLPAVTRANPGERPALYTPGDDGGETLEIDDDDMIAAVETIQRVVTRSGPHPGRLRVMGVLTSVALVAAVAVLWLPGALREHTLGVVPQVKRSEIGTALFEELQRGAGGACGGAAGQVVLEALAERLKIPEIHVALASPRKAVLLPGGTAMIDRSVVEDYEDPAVAAGFLLAETQRAEDPLSGLLRFAGTRAAFRLLTTGELPQEVIRRYAERLLAEPTPLPQTDLLLATFAAAGVPSSPFAYALDVSGESVLPLIEADPLRDRTPPPVLNDGDWVRLQQICEE